MILMKKKNRHHDGLTALVQAALSSLSFTTATVLFLGVAGGVNGQAIGPFPFDSGYEIDIGDDECLHYAGRWSPESSSSGSGSGGSDISVGFDTAAPFVVETTAPVIINRITDGSSSRLSWGVPWGVNVIVKSDCSNNNVLSEPIEPTVTTSTTELNGQQVPIVSISDLPTIPTSQSRSSVFVGTEADFLPSSTFLLNHTCYSQIEACEPIETGSPTTTPVVDTTPTAICPAGIGSSTGNNNIGGSESIGPPISTNPTPTSSPPPTPDSTPIATTTTTTSNPTAAGSSSSSSFTNKPTYINLILGFVSTFALLILSTGFTNNIQGGGGAGTGGRFIMFISTICLIVVAVLLPSSSTFALESSSSSSSSPLLMKDQQQRNLQSSQQQCTINVEIVYWGCEHEVYIKNSNAGVILRDNTGDNYTEDWNTCQCQDNHKFEDIIDDGSNNPFNMINNVTTTDDDTMYHHIPGGSELSPTCNLAIGRPYRDKYTGNIVSASSCIITDTTTSSSIGQQQQEEKEKRRMIWSAPSSSSSSSLVSDHHDHEEDNSSSLLEASGVKDKEGGKQKRNYLTTAKDNKNTKKTTNNNSNKEYNNQWMKELGEDWTDRALGEHASIASFASFTIELMSNGAPPNLIDSSLIAAQDELRHAKISFEIASELHTLLLSTTTTNDNDENDDVVVFVEPTVLPPSKLQFENNLTQLALGTAQEGCIDETFSAIEMAINYDQYYSTKDEDDYDEDNTNMMMMMERIMEITRTIALEEGNHSALAWRTIQWVCNNNNNKEDGGDDNACQSTQNEILNPSKLLEVGQKRFPSSVEAQQIWNCIWTSLLPEVVRIGDRSGDGQELLVELEQQANNVDDAATSLCSWGDIVIDGTGDSDSNNDKNKNRLSMLLANKIISQVKAASKTTTSLV